MVKELGGENFTVDVLKALNNAKGELFQGLNPKLPSCRFI